MRIRSLNDKFIVNRIKCQTLMQIYVYVCVLCIDLKYKNKMNCFAKVFEERQAWLFVQVKFAAENKVRSLGLGTES